MAPKAWVLIAPVNAGTRQTLVAPIDCSNVVLPFGPQFVSDIVNRTHVAQDQDQALLATELVLKAQKNAQTLHFSS